MIVTLLAFIFVLGVLVFLHEFGHFITAKLTGIRVERFSMGYPPRAFGKKIGETDYCISYIPLGGYCKMSGMVDESLSGKIEGKPWEFMSKSAPVKALVISAGPIMNFLLAIFIFAAASFILGEAVPNESSTIGEVLQGTPAAEAGLMPGDKIIAIDSVRIEKWNKMTDVIQKRPDSTLTFTILRNGEKIEKEITTMKDTVVDVQGKVVLDGEGNVVERGVIGIYPQTDTLQLGVGESIVSGFRRTYMFTKLIAVAVSNVVTGKESIKSFGGPIIIAKLTGESINQFGIEGLFMLMAFLSLNFGFLNLLPIPVFDGGHLVFILIEAIIRRPVPVKAKLIIHQVVMALLFVLIIIIVYNDIIKWLNWK